MKSCGMLRKALAIANSSGDLLSAAEVLIDLGEIQQLNGNLSDAEKYYQQSLINSERAGDKRSAAKALANLGLVCQVIGDWDASLSYYELAKRNHEDIGDNVSVGQDGE